MQPSFFSAFSTLWLLLWSAEQSQTKEGDRRKRSKGCDSALPLYLAALAWPDAPQGPLTRWLHTRAAAEAAQLCFSTRRYTAIADASPGANASLKGIKQGAYSLKSSCQSICEWENGLSSLIRCAALWGSIEPYFSSQLDICMQTHE